MELHVVHDQVTIGWMLSHREVYRRVEPMTDRTFPMVFDGRSLLGRQLLFHGDGKLENILPVDVFGDGLFCVEYLRGFQGLPF